MNIYIGNYIEVLKTFHNSLGVDLAVAEKRNADEEILRYCEKSEIKLFLAESSSHLNSFLNSLGEQMELCIVASFGLLLESNFLKKVNWTVNIHPGSLETCRGRHPLPFAINKGLPFMTVTAHLIENEKIDNGPVVATLSLPIDYEKSYAYNDHKLRANLPFFTELIVTQYKNEGRILTGNLDLSNAPYNKRLEGETLNEMTNAKNLLKYK